ncbi:phage tail tip fiber protein, partial [Escherichia coli]|uniref:phage tail tip fiber protein n=1 Tax=Escherichia coli TaxID=562 RepID=UPI0023403E27
ISAVSADKKTVTVATAFSQVPVAGAVWAIDSDNLAIQYFRVTSIAANDDSTGGFTITAVQHDPNKYRYIDDGVRVESPPITVTPISVLSAPKNIVVTESDHVSQGLTVASLDVSWDKVEGAIRYVAQWRKDNGDWINVPVTSAQGFSVQGIYSGSYDVRVRALNAQDTSSPWGYGETTYLSGKTGKPGTPLNFLATEDVVWHIDLTWKFPDGSGDTAYTEIQRATTADYANPELLVLVPYPAADYQHGPMPAGVRQWYRARLIDRIGNAGDWTDWIMGTSSIDVSEITNDILEDMKESETFKDLIENAVDSNEKIAGMADEIKNHADELEQQAKDIQENADGLAQAAVKIDEISVSMDGMTGGVKNSAIAIIQNGLAQVVSRRSQTATNAGNSASIDRVDTTIADTSQAVARALVTLDAEAGGNISNSTDLTETLADFTQASATKINTLTVKSGENSAAINVNAQAIADVNGNLSAMYNIKVGVSSNGQYYAAGMGIGVQNTPSGMQSQVIFLADRFAVTTAAGNSVALPFVIQNGQTFIRASFIQDGTIENAKIGNYIQSNNYAAGSAGWKLNKTGDAEFNNVTVRGVVYASGGRFTGEIQATSGKFKGTVEAQSFIGDIANMHTGTDVSRSSDGLLEKVITYTDSSSSGHARHVCVIANVKGNGAGLININGNESGSSVQDVERLIMHSAVVTGPNVTVRIKVSAQNNRGASIYSPTVIVSHGSGSFTG